LKPNINRANERTGKWTPEEDTKLKDALQMKDGNNWGAVAALVPGRTKNQCWHRWCDTLNPSIDRAYERTGDWIVDEDSKLKDTVQTHVGKNWDAIAAMVPGRVESQCRNRW
jgi:myb proto-oncogene protein